MRSLPSLRDLHLRHHALTPALGRSYAEAAGVCLSRHHIPPIPVIVSSWSEAEYALDWQKPTARERTAWANTTDAIEAGAYSLALAVLEECIGMVAVARAETFTGCDFYVAPVGSELESVYRLEVSGVDAGSLSVLRRRLREKIEQARAGISLLPALACVVGFQTRTILIDWVSQ